MADKNDILSDLSRLETALADTYAVVGAIKDSLTESLAENAKLSQENERLRTRIDELENSGGKPAATSNLMKIYEEGFHVCRAYYGKVLEDGENCLLCQEMLFR